MSWIGLTDGQNSWFAPDGLAQLCNDQTAEQLPAHQMASNLPLPQGSLVAETHVSPYDRPQTLLGVTSPDGTGFRLTLQAVPGGGVVLVIHKDDKTCHAAVNLDTGGRADVLRVTYSWETSHGLGRLTVEQPGTFRVIQRTLEDPVALSLQDMEICIQTEGARVMSSDMSFLATSNRIEPIGPMPSLAADVPIMTADGYRLAGRLQRGDVVQTASGALVPILAKVIRTVPAAGQFTPIRLRAPYFGLSQDIVTSPVQRLVIGGSRVEYMFGAEHVLVPAGHLLHGKAATRGSHLPLTTYCQFLLPDHEAILAAGTFVESLNIGRLRRRRDILRASMMWQFPSARLPEHARAAYPELREFDALTLAAQRAA